MGLYQIKFFLFLLFSFQLYASQTGQILFLLQKGDHSKALELYNEYVNTQGKQDYELLHQIGLGILSYGFNQSDPEIQLLSLFGATVSIHEDANYIIRGSLSSRYPEIQLIGLSALAKMQNDESNKAISLALSSPHALIRLEAVHQLCLKKDPQAVGQAESLMYKLPKEVLPIFPQLFAMVGNEKAIRLLRKFLNDPSQDVRIASILSIAKYGRDDLLPQIRQQALQMNYAQQESAAFALGVFKDENSISQLTVLSKSQYPNVRLAALVSLYHLGKKEAVTQIEEAAKKEDLFSVLALSDVTESLPTLLELQKSKNLNVRVNATLALLEQEDSNCFKTLPEIILRNKYDYGLIKITSSGQSQTAWKMAASASQVYKEDVSTYIATIEKREEILRKILSISASEFYKIAEVLFNTQQHDLIPTTVELLEELDTPEAIALLKKHHQQLGAPFIRNYCNLALYRLKEQGPYSESLRQWVKGQNKEALIQFRALEPWKLNSSHQLTPEETSKLLVESFEAFARNQDQEGIKSLIDAIQNGHPKNKYALAGLLIRATQ